MGSARNASSCAAIIGIPSLFFSSAYSCRHSHGSFHRATVLAREEGLLVVQRFGGLPPHQSCKREWPPRGHHCVRVQGEACFFGFQLFISALDELCSSMNSLPATLTTPKKLQWWGHRSWTPRAGREHQGEGTGDPCQETCCHVVRRYVFVNLASCESSGLNFPNFTGGVVSGLPQTV